MEIHFKLSNFKYVYIFIFVLFSFENLTAQKPVIDQNLRLQLIEHKNNYFQSLLKGEKEITKNQQDYDAQYYSLDIILDPASGTLTGTVEMTLEVLATTLDHVELNFWQGMIITDIHPTGSPGTQLSYTHLNDILSVSLNSVHAQGEKINLSISYYGSPQNSNYFSFGFDSRGGNPMIWTRNQPYGARAWWPCKDFPSDKADSVDIKITAPDYLTVASNGTLMDTITAGGQTTWWWHEKYPIVTYLVSIAAYPYTVYYDDYIYNNGADTMKIHFYVFPENYNTYYATNALVKNMIACFDSLFGSYPFIDEKYGHADDLGGGAMEHQTCSSFSFWGEAVYAHELAHQWWGDLITCNSYHHIWLNEGFATYSEALWYERAYPDYTASEYQLTYNHYLGPGTVYVEDPLNEPIFHGGLSYNKGSWVLHMLRHVTGDSMIFEILHTYYNSSHQHGTVTTEEFQALCEQVSGINLEKFFQQWIYTEYYPYYSYSYQIYPLLNSYKIKVNIDQIQQNTGLFWMPIDIKVTTDSYDTVFVAWDSLQSQTFEFSTSFPPQNLELDPNNWILKETEHQLIAPYVQNLSLNKNYQKPGIDTLSILTSTFNPDNHDLTVTALIKNSDNSVNHSVQLYDDGFHQDSLAGDGIFAGRWPVLTGEEYYHVSFQTFSLDSGYFNIQNGMTQFTTIGPVVFDKYTITTPDTVVNHGDVARLQFTIKNESLSDTVFNISSKLIALDTCATPIANIEPEYGNIAPGELAVGNKEQIIRFDADCPDSVTTNLRMEILSDGYLFWSDTISILLTKDPTDIQMAENVPNEFALKQNYPNPFNPTTNIQFSIPKIEFVKLKIYNILGQEVATLVSEKLTPGNYTYSWDASDLASDVYYYKIQAGEFSQVKKLILMK